MAAKNSPTLAVLLEIRDQIQGTNARIEQTNSRLDQTNARLERVELRLGDLEKRQTQTEIRLSTEIAALSLTVSDVRDLLRTYLADRHRLDSLEERVGALERRVS